MGGLSGIHWKDPEAVILNAGFTYDRTRGDHRVYVRDDVLRPVIIPMYDELPPRIIKNCLNTPGITRREFMEFLGCQN